MEHKFKRGDQVVSLGGSMAGNFDGVGTIVNDGTGGWAVYVYEEKKLYTFPENTTVLFGLCGESNFLPSAILNGNFVKDIAEMQSRMDMYRGMIISLYGALTSGKEAAVIADFDDAITKLYLEAHKKIDELKTK